jgi:hypothetical protein
MHFTYIYDVSNSDFDGDCLENPNMVMSIMGLGLEYDCADEAQQQLKTTYPSSCERGLPT